MSDFFYGGIEAGGTKFVCAVGTGPGDLRAVTRFPTTTPEETLERANVYFREQQRQGSLTAIGIASFGPADVDVASPTFGSISSTPKAGWAHTDVVGSIRRALGVPVGFDTDVNGAALGEHEWGAAIGLDNFVYLTIGTGIGGGAIVNGELVHGMLHPEMGHIRIPHDLQADPYPGGCFFHKDCLEGLANGPAIQERWGQRGEALAVDHPAWDLEANYLALALQNLVCTLSPQRIVMGGGVMKQPRLLPLIRERLPLLLNGYVNAPALLERTADYVVAPALGDRAGVLGAIALARRAASV